MADLQLPEGGPSNIGPPPPSQPPFPAATTAIPTSTDNLGGQTLAPKRQRRPSVRLGEIGDQPATLSYETHLRRNNKIWRLPKDSSKTRPLTNLVTNGVFHETLDADGNNTIHEFTNRRAKEPKTKRASVKRVRSNWVYSKTDEFGEGVEKFGSKEDGDNGCSELEPEGSDNDLKYQSPDHSVENLGQDLYRRPIRARVSHSGEHDGIELDGMPESNSRDQKYDTSADGIRNWLIGLGLGRYAPVFEIHEVDDEVLPLLTLEDLKDMGVNAVGSRRKMYAAIQKLRKGFS